ncbi:3-isopropylmalate dehydrogenase [Dehalogenimonas alkenigignens]|uniref:3-isopropylmalate dehydrogenase n=1 Tax=Dehalogenimonas alkenigignens TaxID=1217799 RepID=A0A0W0GJE2_9CHLR|nr:3-isopropylmalate dehydrogenase [Dehalogenimonas alkenigignens]KTB48676.1 3-isopropylmalate dehydrogenase [Dehalogenimonas alkenigignens]PVV84906.1 3-isopropylmalate dehydrogenase [Dehalogenimonas alkenigignens]
MKYRITVLPGDGIGPDVMAEGVKVLQAVGRKFGHSFKLEYELIGAVAIDKTESALPEETLAMCKRSDAVMLAAVGDPRYDDPKLPVHPEDGLLALRKGLGLFANLRPVRVFDELVNASTLKPEVLQGTDFVFVRELTGGVYFAKPKKEWVTSRGRKATDSMTYSEQEIERIIRVGFELARARKKRLVSVDKANVLKSSRLWRQVAVEVSRDYPDVALSHVLVDACAMQLIRTPAMFDVIVTENLFGDILSDEAAQLAGSMGMLPSASLSGIPVAGKRTFGLYEPIHGSAPTIAGKDIANPIATILSVAMMLRHSLALDSEAAAVEQAAESVLKHGYRTDDIMAPESTRVGTRQMGDLIAARI